MNEAMNEEAVNKEVIVVDAARLEACVARFFRAHGVPEMDARLVADSLVQADLWGHQSHGVLRASWYIERLRHGVMSPVTAVEAIRDKGCLAVLDGKDGVGQVVAERAMRMAIAKARDFGIGAVAVRNSNHFGTLMYYTRMAAQEGCIAFMTSNGGKAMAPWGGARNTIIGTNPWSIAAPGGAYPPLLLDMANTGVARGKIYLARKRREKIPLGWALDAYGAPTDDPDAAIAGIILPMARHKGYAIAVLMDVLAGVLSGSAFLSAVNGPYHYDRRSGCGHFITVYHIEDFIDPDDFTRRIEAFAKEIKSQPLAQGFSEIFLPGEQEARASARQSVEGIALPGDTWSELLELARETGTTAQIEAVRKFQMTEDR
jgi:LDH2 family malate/lactate/ureidoglycolate dehydrogenase